MGRRGGSYPMDLRVRAVRLVLDHGADYPTQWAAIKSVARQLNCTTEALRRWVRDAERGGVASSDTDNLRALRVDD